MSSPRTIIVCIPSFIHKRTLTGWLVSTYPEITKSQIVDMGVMYMETAKSLNINTDPRHITSQARQLIYSAMHDQLEQHRDKYLDKDIVVIAKPKFILQSLNSLFGSNYSEPLVSISKADIVVADTSTSEDRQKNKNAGKSQLEYITGKLQRYTETTNTPIQYSIIISEADNPDYVRNGESIQTRVGANDGDGVGAIDITKAAAKRG